MESAAGGREGRQAGGGEGEVEPEPAEGGAQGQKPDLCHSLAASQAAAWMWAAGGSWGTPHSGAAQRPAPVVFGRPEEGT